MTGGRPTLQITGRANGTIKHPVKDLLWLDVKAMSECS